MVELDAEAAVDGVELNLGKLDHLLPDGEVFLVAVLEFHEFLAGLFEDGGIGFAGGVDGFVKTFHLRDGIGLERGAIELGLPADEQLAELRAPIADVVVRDDAMAEEAEEALREHRRCWWSGCGRRAWAWRRSAN